MNRPPPWRPKPRSWGLNNLRQPLRRAGRFVAFALPLCLLLVLIFLNIWGLPSFMEKDLHRIAEERGFKIEFSRLYFSVAHGVVAEDFKWYSAARPGPPVIEARKVSIAINPFRLFVPEQGVRGINLHDAKMSVDFAELMENPLRTYRVHIDHLEGEVRFLPDGIKIEDVNATFQDIRLNAYGSIRLEENWNWAQSSRSTIAVERRKEIFQLVYNIIREIEAIDYTDPPKVRVVFNIEPKQPENSRVNISIRSPKSTRVRGVLFDDIQCDLELRENQFLMPRCKAVRGDKEVRISGRYWIAERMIEGKGFVSLEPHYINNLMPQEWRQLLEGQGLLVEGSMESEVEVERVSLKDMNRHFRGAVRLNLARYRDIWFERAAFQFIRDGEQLHFSDIDAVVGRSQGKGPLQGDLFYDAATGGYNGSFNTGFDPSLVLSMAGKGWERIIRHFEFQSAPPEMEWRLSGGWESDTPFVLQSQMQAQDFFYKGAEMSDFSSDLTISNRVVKFKDFNLERDEGTLTGWVQYDGSNKTADVNALSSIDPEVLARIVGPFAERIIRPFIFKGQAVVEAKGHVDWGKHQQYDLEGMFYAEDFGWSWFVSEDTHFSWEVKGNQLAFNDIKGRMDNGPFTGSFRIDQLDSPTNITYALHLDLKDADLSKTSRRNLKADRETYEGVLSGTLDLTGTLGEDWADSMAGRGNLQVEDGALFKIPLLGGLSQGLSRIVPGFGYTTQTDFSASYKIKDQKFKTRDAQMLGELISVYGQGHVGFDKHIDFKVQVKLLKEGMVAELIQKLTWPVTKLLELDLSGYLYNPEWRPDNLPEDAF